MTQRENETNKNTHVPDQTLLQRTEMIIKDIPPRQIGIVWLKNGMVSENNSGHGSHGQIIRREKGFQFEKGL